MTKQLAIRRPAENLTLDALTERYCTASAVEAPGVLHAIGTFAKGDATPAEECARAALFLMQIGNEVDSPEPCSDLRAMARHVFVHSFLRPIEQRLQLVRHKAFMRAVDEQVATEFVAFCAQARSNTILHSSDLETVKRFLRGYYCVIDLKKEEKKVPPLLCALINTSELDLLLKEKRVDAIPALQAWLADWLAAHSIDPAIDHASLGRALSLSDTMALSRKVLKMNSGHLTAYVSTLLTLRALV